ncbi:Major facilitator superfamily domain, general substrate transporter [Penicillium occitanis (nom. inval.)]|nr:Major facilitator superfamily domain, general substrate transporter [Penicillium occitanis (nom. inval.)]PCH09747.1 hypothetical protein PENOC_007590 [Penicillium occitanis (nom. inval.)]
MLMFENLNNNDGVQIKGNVGKSFSVYLEFYLDNDYFPGTSSLDYSLVGGTNFLAALWVAPFVNILAGYAGTKACMLLGSGLISGGLVAASFAREFWQLMITQGIMVGAGMGFLYDSTVPIVSQWFWKKRSFAQGITAGGSGLGGLIFSASISPMIQNISLAWALRIQGIICFVTLFLASTIAIAPLSAEIAGLEELPSLLAIVWIATGPPCFFSEAIALQLRRPDSNRPYLYAQLYAGLSYIASGLSMLELRRIKIGLFARERRLQ